MNRTPIPPRDNGYSLLEALLVVALIAAVATITLPMMFRFLQTYRIQSAAQQIAINLRFARNAAIAQKVRFQVVFHDELATSPNVPNTYQMLSNISGSFAPYNRADVYLPPALTILSGGLGTVEFDARGAAVPSGNVTLKGTDLSEYRITVTTAGGITLEKTNDGIY